MKHLFTVLLVLPLMFLAACTDDQPAVTAVPQAPQYIEQRPVAMEPYRLTKSESDRAKAAAQQWYKGLGGQLLSCKGMDSDRDMNVTCSGTDSAHNISEIQCDYGEGSGCKKGK